MPARLDGPPSRRLHPGQVRMAFGGDPAHRAEPAVLLGLEGGTATVGLLRDGTVHRFELSEPGRAADVLARPDLCRLDDQALLLVNARYGALGVAVGPPVPPDHLEVAYGVCRIEGGAAVEVPGDDGQPSWHVFAVREVG